MKKQGHRKHFQNHLRKPSATGHGWEYYNLRQRQDTASLSVKQVPGKKGLAIKDLSQKPTVTQE